MHSNVTVPFACLWALPLLLAVLMLVLPVASTAAGAGPQRYDGARYQQLARSTSAETIEPRTQIGATNWQHYKQFLPIGLQALFSGAYFWKIPNDPNFVITVAPTRSNPLPSKFLRDTEQYAKQTRLVVHPDGGTVIEGYIAGLPFPAPTEPERGAKIMWNVWYTYSPFISRAPFRVWLEDSHLNIYTESGTNLGFRLSGVSDLGVPHVIEPMGDKWFVTNWTELDTPEQAKYTTALTLYHRDQNINEELYAFVPSLRRPLRLSSLARCSPSVGTDFTREESGNDGAFTGYIPTMVIRYLGDAKVLTLFNASAAYSTSSNYSYTPLIRPRPLVGQWELREVYIIDIMPTTELSRGYCYGHRIMYVDKQTFSAVAEDLYDPSDKLWKVLLLDHRSVGIPGSPDRYPYIAILQGFDIQNAHMTFSIDDPAELLSHVPAQYHDVEKYGTPSGLGQIMQ